jgi:uncharacterized protein
MFSKYALVTGASSGIGLGLAERLAQNGWNLVLVARSREKLENLAKEWSEKYQVQVLPIVKDLSKISAPLEVCEIVRERKIFVEILVNNAGFATFGRFDHLNYEKELKQIDVNNRALVALTRLFLPEMLEKKQGRILNVASTAAFQPIPKMATYAASKAFVLSFSVALQEEARSKGVQVTALCPGATKTNFFESAKMEPKGFFGAGAMTVEEVVEEAYTCLFKNKAVAVPGLANKLGAWSTRFVPIVWAARIARKVMGH